MHNFVDQLYSSLKFKILIFFVLSTYKNFLELTKFSTTANYGMKKKLSNSMENLLSEKPVSF